MPQISMQGGKTTSLPSHFSVAYGQLKFVGNERITRTVCIDVYDVSSSRFVHAFLYSAKRTSFITTVASNCHARETTLCSFTATPERSFNQLKHIKNYNMRSSSMDIATKTEPSDGDSSSPW